MNTETLTFLINMREMGLSSLASNARNTFNGVQAGVNATTRSTDRLVTGFDNVGRSIRNARTEANSLSATTKDMGSMLGKAAGTLGIGLSVAAGVAFAKESIGKAMDFGATSKSFEVLTGSKTGGKQMANDLNKLQQDTILGPEVFKAAQTMLGFGVAQDKVMKTEKEIGDVAMGNSDHFNNLTLAFSQTTAAGKLMGQDLLQYINAGFNPLTTMSEHWKEFGLTSKKSVGELKEMMEKGQISSAAVAKAFEVATGKGGKFNDMMNQLGDTSFGQSKIMEGAFENMQIQLGTAMMPMANDLMDVANKTMAWLDISKTAPDVLSGESQEITTLVSSISKLNVGNDERTKMLDTLVAKYPDLFGNIDKETISNGDLLAKLDLVNAAYRDRIALAGSTLGLDTAATDENDAQKEMMRSQEIADAYKRGDSKAAHALMHFYENGSYSDSRSAEIFQDRADNSRKDMDNAHGRKNFYHDKKAGDQYRSDANKVLAFTDDQAQMGGIKSNTDYARIRVIAKELKNANPLLPVNQGLVAEGMKIITPTVATTKKADDPLFLAGKGKKEKGEGKEARGITGGGPRVININGVKFADKIEIHASSADAGMHDMEDKLEIMYLRILNSGASVK